MCNFSCNRNYQRQFPQWRISTLILILIWLPSVLFAQDLRFFANQIAGAGSAQVQVEVVNAAATTGDQYQVTFTSTNNLFFYSVENMTTQQTVVDSLPVSLTSPEFDGLRVSVSTAGISRYEDFIEISYNGLPVNPPAHIFRPGDRQGEGGNNSSNAYSFVGGGGNGGFNRIARNEENSAFFDYELRFDGNPNNRNKMVYYFDGTGTIDVPFSLWNVGKATPDDPGDDYQIIAVGFDDSGNPASYDGGAQPSDNGAGTMFDRIYFYEIDRTAGSAADINNDGQVDYNDFLQDIINHGGDISQNFDTRPYVGAEVLARFSMVALNGDPAYLPPSGTTIRINTTKNLTVNDVHEFNSSLFELVTNTFELNFGDFQVGNQRIMPLTLINNSANTITVSDITSSSSVFQPSQTSLTINAGDSASVDVSFMPTAETIYADSLIISSNDALFPQYRLFVRGEGLPETTGIINLLSRTPIPNIGVTDLWGYYDPATNREYAIIGGSGISIVDVTDPSRPQLLSQVTGIPGFDVKVWSHYAYTVNGGTNGNGGIVDISNPANPQIVGGFPSSHNIFITDDGYMIAEVGGLKVYNLNPDPTNPALIFSGGSEGHDASVIGNRLYDFHGRAGTFIYDFSNPASPNLLSSIIDPTISYNHSGWTSKDGSYLYITDELAQHPSPDIIIYDIRNLGNPTRVGGYADPNATIHNLFVIGNYALTSYYNQGFQVFDVSNPDQFVLADQFDTAPGNGEGFGGAFGIYPFAPSGNIYISDQSSGLHIFSLDTIATAIDPEPISPTQQFALYENYPNPFNPETQIRYQISDIRYRNGNDRLVNLVVFDVQGRKVRTLVNGNKQPGSYTVSWNGRDDNGHQVASGLYFYRLDAGDFQQTRKMILIR